MSHCGPRRKLRPEEIANRYKERACVCGAIFLGYGSRILCDACKAAYQASPEGQQKRAAYVALKRAMRRGEITSQPCGRCASSGRPQRGKSHAHHEDYTRPLSVEWLCSWHHIDRHQEIAREKGLKYFNASLMPNVEVSA